MTEAAHIAAFAAVVGMIALGVLGHFALHHNRDEIIDGVDARFRGDIEVLRRGLIETRTKVVTLYEASDTALYTTDPTGRVVGCNQAYLDFWGFSSKQQAFSDEWLTFLTPESRIRAGPRVARLSNFPSDFDYDDITLVDGRDIRIVGHAMFDGDELIGYSGAILPLAESAS